MRKKEDAREGKKVKSGSALFMYIVIALMLVASVAAFVLYYGKYVRNACFQRLGIVA